ncbi:sulfotransferase family 2 domain-containing protein [Alkalibacillus haloalkaliphilus]|uniref:sulfotransferase family 2 domain-containing protein n=1 Tax=Alkalibacillus haloalkaliphilus TaxID=94136 RepID=UPI00030C5E9B|nr:sulfotransferase family 2 domain-containing protein [Alkalibacillus haloalkaliphilus]
MIQFDQIPVNEKNPVIYIHIPKTGGKTMWGLFEKQDELIHIWHNRYFEKLNERATYLTMLRHPVDRVISTYYYIKQYKRDPLNKVVNSMSLEDFLGEMQDNTVENKRYKSKSDIRNIRYRTVNLSTRYLAGGDPDAVKRAKRNMRRHFAFVGIMDLYLESLYVMQKMYGWDFSSIQRRNSTKGRPKLTEIDPNIIQTIETYNQHDMALYTDAKKILKEKLNQLKEQERYELNHWLQQRMA